MNTEAQADTATQLVTIPEGTAYAVFTTETGIDPYLARVRKEIDAFKGDATTAAGRKAIASMAYVVARTKTYLEEAGKALADEQKLIPKKIDAARKKMKDTLDQWRDEVRKPLTDWEAAEEARVARHTNTLTNLNDLARLAPGRDSAGLRESITLVERITIGPNCEEFEDEYVRATDAALTALKGELARAEVRDAEQAELVRLRQETTERAAKDREEEIKRHAAAEATKAAEAVAQRKIDAEAAATQRAKDEAAAAIQRAADTEARLLKKAADDKAAAESAALRREANKKHCAGINNRAVAAFVKGGMTEKAAMQAVTLIAQKAIPAITITY